MVIYSAIVACLGMFLIFANYFSGPVEKEITITVLDRLGNLTSPSAGTRRVVATHETVTFMAELDSGLGADYVWNVTATRKSVSHLAPSNLGLSARSDVTFVHPDVYDITVRLTHISCSTLAK